MTVAVFATLESYPHFGHGRTTTIGLKFPLDIGVTVLPGIAERDNPDFFFAADFKDERVAMFAVPVILSSSFGDRYARVRIVTL